MNERRRVIRPKTFLRGRVHFADGRVSFDCIIRSITHLGARIAFSDVVSTPDAVTLLVSQKNRNLRANVIWRRHDEIGLSFAVTEDTKPQYDYLVERLGLLESELASLRALLPSL